MGNIAAGTPVPLNVQLPTDDSSVFCRATILGPDNTELTGSPVPLPYLERGNYGSSSFVMPASVPWIKAIYEIFTDSGFTTPSDLYGGSEETFYLDPEASGNLLQTPRFTGKLVTLEEEDFTQCRNLFTIEQGTDVMFDIRLLNDDNGVPVDLDSVSSMTAKFLNLDGTILSVTPTKQVPNVLGQIQISLSATQTALLQYGKVSFEIDLVILGAVQIVQFPYMLNVLQSVFN